MQKKSTVIVRLVVFALILVVINMIASKLYFRLDFTDDQRYTLSKATKDVLNDIEDVITIKAYFSEDLPPQLLSNRQDFEDLLLEYENRSGGDVVYEFISPNEDEELEAEAQQNGIQPLIINVSEKDQVQQLKAYMGAILMMGDRQEVIPIVRPGVDMEFGLTTSIKKLAVIEKPKVGLLQGHGEPTVQEVAQLAQQLSVLYDIIPVDLTSEVTVPDGVVTLVVLNPTDTIPSSDLAKMDQFISSGGNIFVAYSNMESDLQTGYLSKGPDTGFEGWLKSKNVAMGGQYVVDDQCGAVTISQSNGIFNYRTQVKFPYFPVLSSFPEHSITSGLESLMLPLVSSLNYMSADSSFTVTELLRSSDISGLSQTPVAVDVQKQWSPSDYREGPQTLALAVEGPIGGSQLSKMVVVSNGQFILNGNPPQAIAEDNVNFASNAIDWLSDDTGLIELRTKGITSRPLETLEDSTRDMLKFGNVALPILLVFIYAFVRRQMYLKKKQGWMEGKF